MGRARRPGDGSKSDFHDVKEVWAQTTDQVPDVWTNPGRLSSESLDAYVGGTLVLEPSAGEALRSQPMAGDDAERRPVHANRRKALRRQIMEHELSTLAAACRLPRGNHN